MPNSLITACEMNKPNILHLVAKYLRRLVNSLTLMETNFHDDIDASVQEGMKAM